MKILNNEKIVSALRCPVCQAEISVRTDGGVSLLCGGARTHCYDIASSGYVNLCLPKQSGGGDSKQAVSARGEFLNGEFYRPVADALRDLVCEYTDKDALVIDAGCGEGYYSTLIAKRGFSVFGVDISKFAAMAAAKRANREGLDNAFFATASVFELPVADGAAGAVVNVFAPCVEKEFSRVLSEDGALIVAWAGERHLMGLKSAIYSDVHVNSERADLPKNMICVREKRVQYTLTLDNNKDILNLFSMTPYYWRTSYEDGEKLKNIGALETEIDIMISVYKNDRVCDDRKEEEK